MTGIPGLRLLDARLVLVRVLATAGRGARFDLDLRVGLLGAFGVYRPAGEVVCLDVLEIAGADVAPKVDAVPRHLAGRVLVHSVGLDVELVAVRSISCGWASVLEH